MGACKGECGHVQRWARPGFGWRSRGTPEVRTDVCAGGLRAKESGRDAGRSGLRKRKTQIRVAGSVCFPRANSQFQFLSREISPTEVSSAFSKAGPIKKRACLRRRAIGSLREAMRPVCFACRKMPRTPVNESPRLPACCRAEDSSKSTSEAFNPNSEVELAGRAAARGAHAAGVPFSAARRKLRTTHFFCAGRKV